LILISFLPYRYNYLLCILSSFLKMLMDRALRQLTRTVFKILYAATVNQQAYQTQ